METHLLPDDLSEDFLSNGKFILLLRNPKDTIVSLYHHIKKDSVQFFSESWDNLVECFVSVKGNFSVCRKVIKIIQNDQCAIKIYFEF